MTRIWSIQALVLALVTACDRPAGEQAVSSPKQTPSRDVESEEAAAVLARVQVAYQAAPSVDVAAHTILTLGGNEIQREDLYEIGPETSFRWQAPGVAMEVSDGRLMAEMDAVPDRVVDVPIEETAVRTAEQVLGEIARPPAFLLLRCGGSLGRWLESMTLGLIGTPRPTGTHAGADGALVVVIEGTRGGGRLVIDSAT
ncbi:MAG: hypothetical protein QF471_05585, partial [Phycisphaerales bacterium]|nr:hypothetical protein [Phycisphaerales bacterium]